VETSQNVNMPLFCVFASYHSNKLYSNLSMFAVVCTSLMHINLRCHPHAIIKVTVTFI